jgi:dihydroorotate dehydrogenase electron transfer subunit
VLVSELNISDLPPEVEIQSVSALAEVARWADYVAIDVPRESLPGLRERLGFSEQAKVPFEAQVLVVTPMPCGGMGECGVCAVTVRRGWKMACKDGPVFDLNELT